MGRWGVARAKDVAPVLPEAVRSVVVSNVFGDDNRGGAAITAATVDAVRRAFPAAHVTLLAVDDHHSPLSRSHRHTLAAYPDVDLLPATGRDLSRPLMGLRTALLTVVWLLRPGAPSLPPSLRRVREADLVVSKGGFVFVHRASAGSLLSLWLTAFPLTFAWRVGVPTVAFSTSIGPFRSRPSRWLNRFLLRRVTLVLPRDERAAAAARELGVGSGRVEQVPDSAFALPPPSSDGVARARSRYAAGERYAAVTVRLVEDDRHLLDALSLTVTALLESGAVDRILVVDQVSADRADSARLTAAAADPRVTHLDEDLAPAALVELYGGAELVIACRLHSAIFSLVAGTPTLAVSIDGTKTEGVFESLGLGENVVPRHQATSDRLTALAQRLLTQRSAQRRAITEAVIPAQAEARSLHTQLRRAVQQP